jgi:hypothetical protein
MRPVWQFEITRDTNAPFCLVREALLDGKGYSDWHPRCRGASPEILEDGERLEILCRFAKFGIEEEAWYIIEPSGERLQLTYRNRFKGWPVLLLMGWWRVRSERIWERFIESLR